MLVSWTPSDEVEFYTLRYWEVGRDISTRVRHLRQSGTADSVTIRLNRRLYDGYVYFFEIVAHTVFPSEKVGPIEFILGM